MDYERLIEQFKEMEGNKYHFSDGTISIECVLSKVLILTQSSEIKLYLLPNSNVERLITVPFDEMECVLDCFWTSKRWADMQENDTMQRIKQSNVPQVVTAEVVPNNKETANYQASDNTTVCKTVKLASLSILEQVVNGKDSDLPKIAEKAKLVASVAQTALNAVKMELEVKNYLKGTIKHNR